MKISGGLTENGQVVGNTYDKYGSRNPLVRWIMRGFEVTLTELVNRVGPKSIHEVGCGEGYWVLHWIEQGIQARGSDFSATVIDLARANALERQLSPQLFRTRSVDALQPEQDSAELVVCCEVLEHLERPEDALQQLQSVVDPYLIISVPREPIWRLLNMVRGKYLTSLGNTPGHIQHWSQRNFVGLVSRYFEIVAICSPFPWTMLLCRLP